MRYNKTIFAATALCFAVGAPAAAAAEAKTILRSHDDLSVAPDRAEAAKFKTGPHARGRGLQVAPQESLITVNAVASQSSTRDGFDAALAIDKNTHGNKINGLISSADGINPWWQVNLGTTASINTIVVYGLYNVVKKRMKGAVVEILDADGIAVAATSPIVSITADNSYRFEFESVQGQYVKVKGPVQHSLYLMLAEVEVYGTFVAPSEPRVSPRVPLSLITINARASQSSMGFGGVAALAIDRNTDGVWYNGSVTHTGLENDPWWQVDLGTTASIDTVVVYGRSDLDTKERIVGAFVEILGADESPVAVKPAIASTNADNMYQFEFEGVQGQYVKVHGAEESYLSLAEVEVYGGVDAGDGGCTMGR